MCGISLAQAQEMSTTFGPKLEATRRMNSRYGLGLTDLEGFEPFGMLDVLARSSATLVTTSEDLQDPMPAELAEARWVRLGLHLNELAHWSRLWPARSRGTLGARDSDSMCAAPNLIRDQTRGSRPVPDPLRILAVGFLNQIRGTLSFGGPLPLVALLRAAESLGRPLGQGPSG